MRWLAIVAVLCLPSVLSAQDWGPVQFLVGKWTGDGSGLPGNGAGAFSFAPDLQGKVLVRKSFAEYPAQGGRPAFRHDDLMIVYREGASLRAIYFDNEDHVIRYAVKPVEGGVAFVSDGAATEARYRLTYTSAARDRVKIRFEVAPPGKEFAAYLDAGAHRD